MQRIINPKTLIISSCCSTKDYEKKATIFTIHDYLDGRRLTKVLSGDPLYTTEISSGKYKPAIDMYIGHQYGTSSNPGPLRESLNNLARAGYTVDFSIVSAGYGLIDSTDAIEPYDICFDKISKASTNGKYTLKSYSNALDIPNSISNKIKDYDLVIFILAGKYLDAIQFNKISFLDAQKIVFICQKKKLKKVSSNILVVDTDSYRIKYTGYGAKYKLGANIFNDYIKGCLNKGGNPLENIANL